MKVKIRKADKLFSEYIRTKARWKCEYCGKTPQKQGLHCSHYWGRGRESTRYEPENCVALCFSCHQRIGHGDGRDEYREFMIKRLGEKRFESLKVQANTIQKRDDKMNEIICKEMLKSLTVDK